MIDLMIEALNKLFLRLDQMIDLGERIALALEGRPRKS